MKYQFQYHKQVLQQHLYTEETESHPVEITITKNLSFDL